MISRLAAFVIWASVAASIVFWVLRLGSQPIAAPAHAALVSSTSGFRGDLSRVFGPDVQPLAAAPAAQQMQADPRFRLIGVVAPRAAAANAEGLALIATDGKPPKAYRVGTPVDGDLVLLAVHARGASLGSRGQEAQVSLELPALPPPATGTMPGSALISPVPRARVPLPLPPPPPQAVPVPEVPMPPDAEEPERQPDPSDRPMYMPPTSAGRPPT
jgi:general secretion pathway protein C